ncbi:MAG: hypothetical protein GY700_02785, partial [Propionibacteriaceae bacterium]|nr:hypothetical protein [Propionibacteriaceae bacterium]
MSVFRLIVHEMLHRRMSFALSLLAVTLAVALVVAGKTLTVGMSRDVTRVMRELGFNVSILPEGVSPSTDVLSPQFGQAEMPEAYLATLAESDIMSVDHLVAHLQKRVQWRGRTVILTGVLKERPVSHRTRKAPMGYNIPRGQVYVSSVVAAPARVAADGTPGATLKVDDTIELGPTDDPVLVNGATFVVGKVLKVQGDVNDMRVYVNLADMQDMLGKPGKINEIMALSCDCAAEDMDQIPVDIRKHLPGVSVYIADGKAVARAKARNRFAVFAGWTALGVICVSALWVGVLAWLNVIERRAEIGVLRAIGVGAGRIAVLFLGRAALLGLLGAVL